MRHALLGFAVLVLLALAPRVAAACIDAGPPNAACNDGGAAWLACNVHSDCPSPQRCFDGTCTCLASCPYDEECTNGECTCVVPKSLPPNCVYDAGYCAQRGRPGGVFCAPGAPDAGEVPDAEGDGSADAVTVGGGGCALGAGSLGGGAAPALFVLFALARRRRR